MGFEDLPLWAKYRDQFPVTRHLIHLNHAAVAPLSKPAADAMRWLTTDCENYGSYHYDKWLQLYDGLREVTATLLDATPAEIAFVKNTSEGIATIALGLDWNPGDRIILFEEEFPANQFPWQRLQAKGVVIDWLRADDPLEKLEKLARGAKLVALSYVQFLTGFRADLAAVGEICHRNRCFFFVDAIQGLGVFPFSVRQCNIDALAADGHKWLLGPEGCGVLFVRQEVQDDIEPVEFGWTNVQNYSDYSSRDMTLRSDAGRYEPGTLNTVGIYGLEASIRFLLSVGIDKIGNAVLERATQIHDGVLARGYQVMVQRTQANGSGIVCFRKEGVDSRVIFKTLKDQNILASPRAGWVRASPHFYISPQDVDQMLEILP